ncbi:MAG: hypothetical protein DDT42_01646 [candidate division WS2 bacterium]|uniref:Uncharacterized protein n=1 Tax=Psychracetigena formicireducens TaxID=2986056 RepID=A0A9E2F1S6_PSYF1|nr:hypothetical protein [Candidatus Psychracetigena formicireducens]MBT9145769.1 hypothetical protein [Candidatus Psychracetigena formicireducens]
MNFEELSKFILLFTPLHLNLMYFYKELISYIKIIKNVDKYSLSCITGYLTGTILYITTSDPEIALAYVLVSVIPAPLIHDFMVFIRKVKNRV